MDGLTDGPTNGQTNWSVALLCTKPIRKLSREARRAGGERGEKRG